eukprot:m.45724 g.45724  ORF g.45724 m.45724 type:complete len:313 (+) comp10894_c0_seq1:253-1191(+)
MANDVEDWVPDGAGQEIIMAPPEPLWFPLLWNPQERRPFSPRNSFLAAWRHMSTHLWGALPDREDVSVSLVFLPIWLCTTVWMWVPFFISLAFFPVAYVLYMLELLAFYIWEDFQYSHHPEEMKNWLERTIHGFIGLLIEMLRIALFTIVSVPKCIGLCLYCLALSFGVSVAMPPKQSNNLFRPFGEFLRAESPTCTFLSLAEQVYASFANEGAGGSSFVQTCASYFSGLVIIAIMPIVYTMACVFSPFLYFTQMNEYALLSTRDVFQPDIHRPFSVPLATLLTLIMYFCIRLVSNVIGIIPLTYNACKPSI